MELKQKILTRISGSNDEIASRVVDALVEEIIKKRVNQVVQAYNELDKNERDLRRLKPDIVSYDENGTVVTSNFSKNVLDNRNKIKQRSEKLQKALDKALDNNDFGDLVNLIGAKGKDESGDAEN